MRLLPLLLLLSCGWLRGDDDRPRGRERGERAERPERAEEARPERKAAKADAHPNVQFIVWDTVRADRMGLYGHTRDTTPRLTAFAREGAVYERAISPGVWTLPSHASMFTGLPASAHGVSDHRKFLDDSMLTFAEVLKLGGYDTWAWSTNPFIDTRTNLTQGFDTIEHPWSQRWRREADAMQKARTVDEVSTRNDKLSGTPWGYTNVGKLAGRALDAWLDDHKSEKKPWLAFINLMEAHATRSPILQARRQVMDEAAVQRSLEIDQRSRVQNAFSAGAVTWSEADLDVMRQVYDASLLELDHLTGELLDALQARGALDNTLVILVADHGEMLGEKGMFGHQFAIWSSLTRVPLVVWQPGQIPAARITEPFSTAALYRLVVERSGVPVPDAARAGFDTARHELGVVTEYTEAMKSTLKAFKSSNPALDLTPYDQAWTAIERGPDKLILGSSGVVNLYDILTDRAEERPVQDAARVAALQSQIQAWKGTFTPYDHEHAAPVAAPIDEDGAARDALRELGYVE